MNEREPRPTKPEDEYWRNYERNPDDMPDGVEISLEQACADAYYAKFRKELLEDAERLKQLRAEAHDPACPCKSCKSANLRERREITKKWQVPDRKDPNAKC